jgi:hypothetical protein
MPIRRMTRVSCKVSVHKRKPLLIVIRTESPFEKTSTEISQQRRPGSTPGLSVGRYFTRRPLSPAGHSLKLFSYGAKLRSLFQHITGLDVQDAALSCPLPGCSHFRQRRAEESGCDQRKLPSTRWHSRANSNTPNRRSSWALRSRRPRTSLSASTAARFTSPSATPTARSAALSAT